MDYAFVPRGVVFSQEGHEGQQGDATIAKAIQQLKTVRGELENAPHDYQGHRENAIKHIDQALEELNKALEVKQH